MLRQKAAAAGAGAPGAAAAGDARVADAAYQAPDQAAAAAARAEEPEDSFSALTGAFSTRISELQELVCLRIEGARRG